MLCTGNKIISYSSRKYLNIINFKEYTGDKKNLYMLLFSSWRPYFQLWVYDFARMCVCISVYICMSIFLSIYTGI